MLPTPLCGIFKIKTKILYSVLIFAMQGKSFLHLYLCSVAEGGQPNMVITDKKNTPLPKRVIMMCSIS